MEFYKNLKYLNFTMLTQKQGRIIFFLPIFALLLSTKKVNAIELVYNYSSTYKSFAFNGFDHYKVRTSNSLNNYHYGADKNAKRNKLESEAILTPEELEMKERLTRRALGDFYNPKFRASQRKNNPELLSSALGFGFGFGSLDFRNNKELEQKNLQNNSKTMLSANGAFININLTLRGVFTIYYSPGIYRWDFIVRRPDSLSSTGYKDTKENRFMVGNSMGFLVRILPFSVSEGIVIGGGVMNVNSTSNFYITGGFLVE